MRTVRTADQWQRILSVQKDQGQSDSECARDHQVCVDSLRKWRKKLRESLKDQSRNLIEVRPMGPALQELRVTLPNGVVLSVSSSWPLEHLVKAAGLLSAL